MGFPKRGGDGTVFFHGKLAGFYRLVRMDRPLEVETDVDEFPERGFFSFFAIAFDGHIKGIYRLSLFAQDGYDVDAAAATDAHQQHLHGTYAEVLSAGFGIAVHANGVTRRVFRFEPEVTADPFQLNPCHF